MKAECFALAEICTLLVTIDFLLTVGLCAITQLVG